MEIESPSKKTRLFYFFKTATSFLASLGIVFIPFPLNLFSYQEKITGFLFGGLITFLKPLFFEPTGYNEISSDSTSLYTLVFILIGISLLLSVAVFFLRKYYDSSKVIIKVVTLIIPYYLSLHLLKYGFDKISMGQFYAPETNILYTPLGYLDKDILFWSTMGISPIFNIFLGLSQGLAGILLLFKKTRFFGFIVAAVILVNIVAINFGFDISVKLFSLFLLFLALIGLGSYASVIKDVFIRISAFSITNTSLKKRNRFSYHFLKSLIVLLIFSEIFYQNFESIFYKDDKIEASDLNGAYSVQELIINGIPSDNTEIERVFIHRDGYLIFQDTNDRMSDYKLEMHELNNQMVLTDYDLKKIIIEYQYSLRDSSLFLDFSKDDQRYNLTAKMLDFKSLPIFNDDFHWTVDGVK